MAERVNVKVNFSMDVKDALTGEAFFNMAVPLDYAGMRYDQFGALQDVIAKFAQVVTDLGKGELEEKKAKGKVK